MFKIKFKAFLAAAKAFFIEVSPTIPTAIRKAKAIYHEVAYNELDKNTKPTKKPTNKKK